MPSINHSHKDAKQAVYFKKKNKTHTHHGYAL